MTISTANNFDEFQASFSIYRIDSKHVTDGLIVFNRNKKDRSNHIGQNMIRYVSYSSCSRTINENSFRCSFFSIRGEQQAPKQACKKMDAQNQNARPIETQLEALLFTRYLPKQHLQLSFLMSFCQMFSRLIETQLETLFFVRYYLIST